MVFLFLIILYYVCQTMKMLNMTPPHPPSLMKESNCVDSNSSLPVCFQTSDVPRTLLVKTYPWILNFRKQCNTFIMKNKINNLSKLMKFYIKNVTEAVKDCYQRPNRASKLKIEMSNTLLFFHHVHKDNKSPIEHFSYLEKMSDLMAMYMDMEIKTSSYGSVKKIASIITSSLKIYFDNYSEYVLDSILKTNLITKRHRILGDLIIRWALRDFPESPFDIITYIRYLLVFKMWKGIMHESKDDQLQIIKLARHKLQPPIDFKDKLKSHKFLKDLFPNIPNMDATVFLLKAKYSAKDASKIFFKALADPMSLVALNTPDCSVNDSSCSFLLGKEETQVDRLLNEIWNNMNNGRSVSANLLTNIPSPQVKSLKHKHKLESINGEIGEDEGENNKYLIKLEIEEAFTRPSHESLCQYEHSIEDLGIGSLDWKSDLEMKKVKVNSVMKVDKAEDLDTSEGCLKSDLEDEIINSSNDCLFGLKEDYSVEVDNGNDGDKCNDGELKNDEEVDSSSLPLKKRRRIPLSKYAKMDHIDTSEINKQFSRNYLLKKSLESVVPLNSSSNCSKLVYDVVSSFCEHYIPCNSILQENCEDCNILESECMNSEDCTLSSNKFASGELEERKMVFKTPAQLKAIPDSINEPNPSDVINLEPAYCMYHKGKSDILSIRSMLVTCHISAIFYQYVKYSRNYLKFEPG